MIFWESGVELGVPVGRVEVPHARSCAEELAADQLARSHRDREEVLRKILSRVALDQRFQLLPDSRTAWT